LDESSVAGHLDKKKAITEQDFSFMTDFEKEMVIASDMKRKSTDISAACALAQYTITSANGRKLRFEVFVGDNGESDDCKTTEILLTYRTPLLFHDRAFNPLEPADQVGP
jgi:hypothetical protein